MFCHDSRGVQILLKICPETVFALLCISIALPRRIPTGCRPVSVTPVHVATVLGSPTLPNAYGDFWLRVDCCRCRTQNSQKRAVFRQRRLEPVICGLGILTSVVSNDEFY